MSIEYVKYTDFKALGLDYVNRHRTTFRKKQVQDDLFISFKLRQAIERKSLKNSFYTQSKA